MKSDTVVLGVFYKGEPQLALWPGYNKPVIVKPTSRPNQLGRLTCQILGPDQNLKMTIRKDKSCGIEQLGEPVSPAVVAELMRINRIVDPEFCS